MRLGREPLTAIRQPAQQEQDQSAYRIAFETQEAELLAWRLRLFTPITAVLLALTEVAPYFSPEFPAAPLLTGSVILVLLAMYVLAGSKPHRRLIGWATVATGIVCGGYAGSASALTGQFESPHSLALAVLIAFLPGILSLSMLEASATMLGAIVAWVAANIYWAGSGAAEHTGLVTCLVYLSFLALVTLLSVWRNRQSRYSEFVARREVERVHRFTVEEVLFRHLPAPYVEQVLSGARTVDQAPERRLITVMFADLVGFTRLTDAMSPEGLADLLARFYDLISTVAVSHGATLDKFIGDAVLVFLGAPQPMTAEEQARRAVQMACEWHRGLPALSRSRAPLQLRVGIHQDVVTVGSFGGRLRTDYTVLGRGVNLAARLQQFCQPGRITVSRDLAQLLGGRFPLTDLGAQQLRGLPEPVHALEINPGAVSTN